MLCLEYLPAQMGFTVLQLASFLGKQVDIGKKQDSPQWRIKAAQTTSKVIESDLGASSASLSYVNLNEG